MIARYQTASEDVNSPIVTAQIEQIKDLLERLHVKPWDYSVFFKRPSGRYRLWIIMLYSFFQQWNGGGLLYSYLPGILEMVGIKSSQQQLCINLGMFNHSAMSSQTDIVLGMTAVSWIATMAGAGFVDRLPRRFILLTTVILFLVFLALIGIFNALYANDIASKAMGYLTMIAIYFFHIATGLFLNVLHNIYPGENLHYTQRAKGVGLYSLFQAAFGFAMTYGSSAALATMKWKVCTNSPRWRINSESREDQVSVHRSVRQPSKPEEY